MGLEIERLISGVPKEELLQTGALLLNMQMAGMLIGGILWGILGDRRGRLSVLFGSIVLYSLANIANACVDSVDAYAVVRFVAGVGLAGELGAGITLVSEMMTRETAATAPPSSPPSASAAGSSRRWSATTSTGAPRTSSAASWARAAGPAHRRARIGDVRQVKARSVSRGTFFSCSPRARARRNTWRDRRRPADLVRRRHPGDVLAGVRRGDGHVAGAERRDAR